MEVGRAGRASEKEAEGPGMLVDGKERGKQMVEVEVGASGSGLLLLRDFNTLISLSSGGCKSNVVTSRCGRHQLWCVDYSVFISARERAKKRLLSKSKGYPGNGGPELGLSPGVSTPIPLC